MKDLDYKISNNSVPLYNGSASMIVVPGLQGDVGIINSERVFTILLNSGVIYIFNNNKVEHRYFVMDGLLVANKTDININAGEIYNLDKISDSDIDALISKVNNVLASQSNEVGINYYNKKLLAYGLMKEKLSSTDCK